MNTPKAPSFEGKAVTTMSSLTAYVDEYLDIAQLDIRDFGASSDGEGTQK